MAKVQRSSYELKKLSDFWFDLAKFALVSLVIKLFEPTSIFTLGSLISAIGGLITFFICAKIGLDFARKVEES